MLANVAAHVNNANDGVQHLADEDENDGLQKWLLDLLPIVQLLVIIVILNVVDLGDQCDGDDGRQDDADSVLKNAQ